MASIMKRGDSYSVRYKYKDHSGKPCEGWESFKTKKEAQERKITVEKELLDGTFLVPNTMTVEEMLYKWIPIQSTKHKWSPKTYTQSVAMVQNLIVPYIGKQKVQELRTYDIEKFYATLAKTPCGQYVHGVKQDLSKKQKKRLRILLLRRLVLNGISIPYLHSEVKGIIPVPGWAAGSYNGPVGEAYFLEDLYQVTRKQEYRDFVLRTADILMEAAS